MSWLTRLYEVYGQAYHLEQDKRPIPISHTLQNAHINIVIDGQGNFKRAGVLEKLQIILPATESSAGRSSGESPHPLGDKLQYVAKDYSQYGGTKKAYFESYKKLLGQWCDSTYSHPKAKAVYAYIQKGEVIKDLINEKIINLNEKNTYLTHWDSIEHQPLIFKSLPKKSGVIEIGDALVCWTVETNIEDRNGDTWKDESLYESWIKFDAMNEAKKGFCFISGNEVALATNHPAKIRHTGDMAKLISSNDTTGYTYRGKFVDNKQACGVSFDVTQKAHNALRWLVRRQGYRNGDQVFIAWAISNKGLPDINLEKLLGDCEVEETNNESSESNIDHGRNLGQHFATRFNNKIRGYRQELNDLDQISILGLDSASPGRMSITYYRETNAKEFYDRLEKWQEDFEWPQPLYHRKEITEKNKKSKSTLHWFVQAPLPVDIAEAAYGSKANDKLKKNTVERILPCILEGRPFPSDLVKACVQSASNTNQNEYQDKKWLWQKNISIACALYKGYYSDRNPKIIERSKYAMSLERDRTNRDYLYGRLLAVAEQIERASLNIANENRITNAERYMQQFSIRPFSTWRIIHDNLISYKNRLQVAKPKLLGYWENEIAQICNLFCHEDYVDNNNPLSGEYLLGYYCQKSYRKSTDSDQDVKLEHLETQTI